MPTKRSTDLLDRQLLNLLQSTFPLVEEPYRVLGKDLGLSEEELLQRISRLKKLNIVRQLSAIFDTRRLGYRSTLVAFRYLPRVLNKAAYHINEHPGVSHNYARNSYFNLWFTLAVPPSEDLDATVERLARETEATAYRVLPTIRFFKIGVNFDMVNNRGAAYDYYSPDGFTTNGGTKGVGADWNKAEQLSRFEIQVVRELQEDLPLLPRPFDGMAERLGISVMELLGLAGQLQERGIMRRFSAVLYHRSAGFSANAMAVWRVPQKRAMEVGLIMAESPWVTHCYERPTFPDWPYSHFSMVHAQTKEECEQVVQEISQKTGITDYQMIYSTREYKKTRVRYFVED